MISVWKKLSEEAMNLGYRKVLKRVFELPDGRKSDFHIKNEGDAACVLALTPDHQVILATQFRPGPEKIFHELPGGGVEPGETPLAAAARELLEEVGYVGDLEFVCTSYVCAYSSGRRHSFVATNCKKVGEPMNLEHEFIEVKTVSLDEFKKHLLRGELSDIGTGYAGLHFLKLL